jgi:glycosyltransferase involved in cell wall biosynthesis
VPVIASRAGGIPEVVEDGITGCLAPVGATDAMADAGIAVLSDPERWKSMSDSARAVAVERFAAARVVDRYEEYYRQVLSPRGGSAAGAQATSV